MAGIRVFSKKVIRDEYEAGVAYSVHFSIIDNSDSEKELNQGFGILFPRGLIREDNTIGPRYALNPVIRYDDGRYIISSDYVSGEAVSAREENYITPSDVEADITVMAVKPTEDKKNMIFKWSTVDFITFDELGAFEKEDCAPEASDTIDIPDCLVKNITDKWIPVEAAGISISYDVCDIEKEAAGTSEVSVKYSDGSVDSKPVIWSKKENGYEGTIKVPEYNYPLIKGFADPVFFKWQSMWYFLATNDLNGNIGLFLREADSVDNLFTEKAKVSVILDYSEENEFIQTFWAPEWHIIGGVPYILFAVGGHKWAPQCHMMKYKSSGSIMDASNWEKPVRVKKKDGSYLTEDGISLDMTYFKAGGQSYVVWSERYGIGTALDTGSMLKIATVDESNPSVLTSEKILLSRPVYGWENVAGTINNEGPYALIHDSKVYLAYSGGAATGHTYAVGYLIADCEDDLLNVENWNKYPTAVLSAYSIEGIDGPGHNSFFTDDYGNTMVAYHGQLDVRSSTVHRVHFGKDGFPILNVSPERDLPKNMRTISVNY